MEFVVNYCWYMWFVEFGGCGMFEEVFGFLLNLWWVECLVVIGNMFGMWLDYVMFGFYVEYCVGCDMWDLMG